MAVKSLHQFFHYHNKYLNSMKCQEIRMGSSKCTIRCRNDTEHQYRWIISAVSPTDLQIEGVVDEAEEGVAILLWTPLLLGPVKLLHQGALEDPQEIILLLWLTLGTRPQKFITTTRIKLSTKTFSMNFQDR
jgi:hypothetical protein